MVGPVFCLFGPLLLTQFLRFHFPLLPNIPPYLPKFPQEFRSSLSPSFRFIPANPLSHTSGYVSLKWCFWEIKDEFRKNERGFCPQQTKEEKIHSLFTQVSWFWINFKNTIVSRELMHLWSDLGKIKFSPRLVGQMTFLMIQMIPRDK